MAKHAQSIDSQILTRIHKKGTGDVFTPADFLDLGTRNAIDLALSRNTRAGTIRKLARGLYDYPRQDPRLGLLSSGTDDIANALKDRDSSRIQAAGAHAAQAQVRVEGQPEAVDRAVHAPHTTTDLCICQRDRLQPIRLTPRRIGGIIQRP